MIKIRDLTVKTSDNQTLLEHISFDVDTREVKCITGTSGSGKSTLLKTLMNLIDPNLAVTSGEILVHNINILSLTKRNHRNILGLEMGFIPQNPMTAFFYHKTLEEQMSNLLMLRRGFSRKEAKERIIREIKKLNFDNIERVLKSYPSELSGGMLQRLTIANLFALEPKVILADEPTSALDEKNKQILLRNLLELKKNAAIIFISHDVNAIKEIGDSVLFLMNGKIVLDKDISELKAHSQRGQEWIDNFISELECNSEEDWKWESL